jgi:hypothetical protein
MARECSVYMYGIYINDRFYVSFHLKMFQYGAPLNLSNDYLPPS